MTRAAVDVEFDFTVAADVIKPTPDIDVHWSEVTHDLRGRPLDPGGFDMLELALWPMNLQSFVTDFTHDRLDNPVLITWVPLKHGDTSANLRSLVPHGPRAVRRRSGRVAHSKVGVPAGTTAAPASGYVASTATQ